MGWAEAETDRASLPDARLKRRLTRVLEQLSAQPTASIPAASGTWADTKAAYRLFDNDRVDAVDILDGHSRATLQRIAAESVVLLVQDTTFWRNSTAHGHRRLSSCKDCLARSSSAS